MTLAYAVVRPNLQQLVLLYFYALIIRPTDRLATDLQNYPDKGVYCYAARDDKNRCADCCAGIRYRATYFTVTFQFRLNIVAFALSHFITSLRG